MRLLALDFETELITRGCTAPRPVCMSWMRDGDQRPSLAGRNSMITLLRSYIEDPRWLLIGANIAFDFGVAIEHEPDLLFPVFNAYEQGRVRDVQVREQLLLIKDGRLKGSKVNLGVLSAKYLGHALDKGKDSWRYRYGELMHTMLDHWPEEARNYATSDAYATLGVYLKQRERAIPYVASEYGEDASTGHDLVSPDERDQTRSAFAFYLTGAWGLRTDRDAVVTLKHNLTTKYNGLVKDLLETDIFHTTGSKKNPRRTKDLQAIQQRVHRAYTESGRPVPMTDASVKYPGGQVSYSTEALSESGDPLLEKLADSLESEKLLNTFIPVLESGTERPINPFWNNLVESGRSSCGGPNIQNLPTFGAVRECFIPRPGSRYINADYSLAELRALGQIQLSWFGSSALANALREGKDIHLDLGAQMLNISYADAVKRKKSKDEAVVNARQVAKNMNFAFPGGLSAKSFVSFVKNNGIKLAETPDAALARAEELRNIWFARWSEMRPYFNVIGQLTGDLGSGTITQYGSGRVRGGLTFTQAANTFFQGLIADVAKRAMWKIIVKCYIRPENDLYGCRMIGMIHDEFLLEAPADQDAEAAEELAKTMVEEANKLIPDIPNIAEPRIFTRWYKGAESVRDEGGRLIPWEPKPKEAPK